MKVAPTLSPDILNGWDAAQRLWGVNVARLSLGNGAALNTFAWFSFPPEVHLDPTMAKRFRVDDEWESILAHELGHHILAPSTKHASIKLNVQMARAIRATREQTTAGHVWARRELCAHLSNIWCDMVINVRVAEMQRRAHPEEREPGVVRVYRALASDDAPLHWWIVMRAYEEIWGLPPGALCTVMPPLDDVPDEAQERALTADGVALDAHLLATAVRAYGHDAVGGALTVGMILAPYMLENPPTETSACGADHSEGAPTSAELAEALRDPRLRETPRHPLDRSADGEHQGNAPHGGQRLGLAETIALHPQADVDEVVRAWYLAEADAYVRPFTEPNPHTLPAGDAIPAALELWEPGDEFTDLDWPGTLAASPVIVPGVTTRRRTFIEDERREPRSPLTLELYIDSSGSMPSPRGESPAILAGIILVLSVLRGGGRVRTTSFSGANQVAGGETFTRNMAEAVQGVLHFFGSGTVFPLDVLQQRDAEPRRPGERRHLVVLSDDGCASFFGEEQPGFEDVAARARSRLASGTLMLLDPRRTMADAAVAAGYAVEYLDSLASAPRACAELAERIVRGSGRG